MMIANYKVRTAMGNWIPKSYIIKDSEDLTRVLNIGITNPDIELGEIEGSNFDVNDCSTGFRKVESVGIMIRR